jgi:hypothetical protein
LILHIPGAWAESERKQGGYTEYTPSFSSCFSIFPVKRRNFSSMIFLFISWELGSHYPHCVILDKGGRDLQTGEAAAGFFISPCSFAESPPPFPIGVVWWMWR